MEQSYTFEKPLAAVIDTGTSLVMVPEDIASDFFGRLLQGHRYVHVSGMYQISCENKHQFPSIYLMVNDHWLQIHPTDYVITVQHQGQEGCMLGFMATNQTYFILGDVFLRGYYTIHDLENDRIGIAPHANSPKQRLQVAVMPSKTQYSAMTENTWLYVVNEYVSMLSGWWLAPIFCFFFCLISCFITCIFAGMKLDEIGTYLEGGGGASLWNQVRRSREERENNNE